MKQSDRDMLIEVHTDMRWMKTQFKGNGAKGIAARISSLENWRAYVIGIVMAVSVLMRII